MIRWDAHLRAHVARCEDGCGWHQVDRHLGSLVLALQNHTCREV